MGPGRLGWDSTLSREVGNKYGRVASLTHPGRWECILGMQEEQWEAEHSHRVCILGMHTDLREK